MTMDRQELQRRYPALIQSNHPSFHDPANVQLLLRLGLVPPTADEWDLYETWGRILRAGYGHESLKKITPAALARLKEEIAGNVVSISPKQRTPKVEQ